VAVWLAFDCRGRSRTEAPGHERRFRDVRDESGLPPTPERLRQRGEPTLRAKTRLVHRSKTVPLFDHARPWRHASQERADAEVCGVRLLRLLPDRDMLQAAIDRSQELVGGVVRLKLYKGSVTVVGRHGTLLALRPGSSPSRKARSPTITATRPAHPPQRAAGCAPWDNAGSWGCRGRSANVRPG
jgi:hypothetical protein